MQYFTRQSIRQRIKQALPNYDSSASIGDLFFETFDKSSYLNGPKKAAKALASNWQADWAALMTNYSVNLPATFGAIQLVLNYQKSTVGEDEPSFENLLNPEKIATQLEYILAAELMDELLTKQHLNYESPLTDKIKSNLLR